MMLNNKQLFKFWERYIDKPIYRLIPAEQKKEVSKKGFNPDKDPYAKVNPKIEDMFKIIIRLEKKGIIFWDEWKSGSVKGSTIVKISRRSIKGKYIDFVADKKQIQTFKKRWDGGCIVTYVFKLTNFLLENTRELTSYEKRLAKYLNAWALKRRGKKSVTLYIQGSNKIFESAYFYNFNPDFKRYWKSPFGSFENFTKTIKKYGSKRYLPFLKGDKLFYLRVKEKISPKDIKFIE
jgi:hypothetical protein